MKKNSYFRKVLRRQNLVQNFIFSFFLGIASYPRLVLEVYLRKNFGQRYFSLASALTVAVILILLPVAADSIFKTRFYESGHQLSFWGKYLSWYIFTGGFLFFSFLRWREIERSPSVFEFGRFSLHSGDINPIFYQIKPFGKKINVRSIETIFEPLIFFVLGFILSYFGQKVGILLMTSSILYGFSYAGAYRIGDDFVMDKIDEIIMNEELEKAFVDDLPSDKTRGVRFYTDKPESKQLRQKLSESFLENEETTYAV